MSMSKTIYPSGSWLVLYWTDRSVRIAEFGKPCQSTTQTHDSNLHLVVANSSGTGVGNCGADNTIETSPAPSRHQTLPLFRTIAR